MITVFINPGRTPEQPEPTPQQWGDHTTNRPTEYNTPRRQVRARHRRRAVAGARTRTTTSRRIRSAAASAAPAPAPSPPSPWPGSAPTVPQGPEHRRQLHEHARRRRYPDIIRKSEKKPIRIFLQDGRNDNRGVGRGGAVRPAPRLVPPERPPDAGADREGLRRELRLGHQHARPAHGRPDAARDDALALARPSGVDRRERQSSARSTRRNRSK